MLLAPAVICIGLAGAYRPWAYEGKPVPRLHAWIAIVLALTAVQLLPLPAPLLDRLSPAARSVAYRIQLVVPSALPISIDEPATQQTLLVNIGLAIVFLCALRIFATGGVRLFARGLALMGLVLSAIALAQETTGHGLMYWRWKPLHEGGPPFGPFVNRNYFGTWAVLAIPLVAGYLAAHATAHHHRGTGAPIPLRRRIVTFFDGRAILLTLGAALMAVALVATLSRSGMAALAAAAGLALVIRVRHSDAPAGRTLWWVAAGAALALTLTSLFMPMSIITVRFSRTHVSAADRLVIWHDTLPMIRDFWLTGTGAGTYETGMLVYQRSALVNRFNTAHNHYLQAAAEGGLVLGGAIFFTLWLYARAAWRRLWMDRSGVFWVRSGALCGLFGVAVQSLWETGLLAPANAALAAVAAAIVIHDPVSQRVDEAPDVWRDGWRD